MSRMRGALRVTLIAVVAVTAVVAGLAGSWLWQQSRAPALSSIVLPDLTGAARRLDEWQGKPLLINFWASWCPPCIEEIPVFIELQRDYGPQGLQVLGIAVDRREEAAAFADKLAMNYPSLHGVQDAMAVMDAYGNTRGTLPYTVLLGADGEIHAIFPQAVTREDIEPAVQQLLQNPR